MPHTNRPRIIYMKRLFHAASGMPHQAEEVESMSQALQGWQAAVHEYVKQASQAEIEQRTSALLPYVADRDHLGRVDKRLARLQERDVMRGAWPSRHESAAKLLEVRENGKEVHVTLRKHLKRTLEQSRTAYVEERFETDRLWLAEDGGRWTIVRIEPDVPERRPRFGAGAVAETNSMREHASAARHHRPHAFRSRDYGKLVAMPYINDAILPNFHSRRFSEPYRRDQVVAYADRWWNEPNPAYENFEVNCTNYVSQCVFAGHAPMNYTDRRDSGWWYKGRSGGQELWSYSWAVSNAFEAYLAAPHAEGMRATAVEQPRELQLGDVITYDWDGDGRYQHSTVVTAFDRQGMPLVNANTVSSRHRYWDYRDSYAWTDRTRYRFFHIADDF